MILSWQSGAPTMLLIRCRPTSPPIDVALDAPFHSMYVKKIETNKQGMVQLSYIIEIFNAWRALKIIKHLVCMGSNASTVHTSPQFDLTLSPGPVPTTLSPELVAERCPPAAWHRYFNFCRHTSSGKAWRSKVFSWRHGHKVILCISLYFLTMKTTRLHECICWEPHRTTGCPNTLAPNNAPVLSFGLQWCPSTTCTGSYAQMLLTSFSARLKPLMGGLWQS